LIFWPSGPENSPYDLSRADGKSRFYATKYSKVEMSPNLSLSQKLYWTWRDYWRRHRKPNPAAYTFPARPIRSCSIQGLLSQCMEVTGTKYFIAVEIAGGVDFGFTNALGGAQWVAAFEHAIETSSPVICYDYSKKRNFKDTLLLVRESPRAVKVVPRTKLVDYQKAGLVKEDQL
jgi:hypothetical protein